MYVLATFSKQSNLLCACTSAMDSHELRGYGGNRPEFNCSLLFNLWKCWLSVSDARGSLGVAPGSLMPRCHRPPLRMTLLTHSSTMERSSDHVARLRDSDRYHTDEHRTRNGEIF